MTIERIVKYKPCRHVDVSRVRTEVERVQALLTDPSNEGRKTYNIHNVPVAGVLYTVADAKVLNKATNQGGRGNLRYLFEADNLQYDGLALEIGSGAYRRVA